MRYSTPTRFGLGALYLLGVASCGWFGAPQAKDAEVNDLLTRLKHEDPTARRKAAVALGRKAAADEASVAALAAALRDPSEDVSLAAGAALGRLGEKSAPALADALKSEEPHIRLAALDGLVRLGPAAKPAVPALVAVLRQPPADAGFLGSHAAFRVRAAFALGEVGPDAREALPVLFEAAKDTSNNFGPRGRLPAGVCEAAVAAVRKIDPRAEDELAKAVVPALAEAVANPRDPRQREVAVAALGEFGPKAGPAVGALKKALADLLTPPKDPAPADLGPLSRRFASLDWHGDFTRQQLFRVLAGAGDQGRAEVLRVAGAAEVAPEHRLEALSVLLEVLPAEAAVVRAAEGLMKNKDPVFRARVARALGTHGARARAFVPLLIEALRDKEMAEAKDRGDAWPVYIAEFSAAVALAEVGKDSVPGLAKALGDRDPLVRRQAALALSLLGGKNKEAAPALQESLRDQETAVALESAGALLRGGADPKEPLRVLVAALRGADPKAAGHALDVLVRAGPKAADAVPVLTELVEGNDRNLRRNAMTVLAELGAAAKPSVPALVKLLKKPVDPDGSSDRPAVLYVLNRLGPHAAEAVPELIAATRDPDTSVRAAAAEALARIGPDAKEAVPALIRLMAALGSNAEWVGAVNALGRIGPPAKDAVPMLKESLASQNRQERVWAAFALAGITRDGAYLPELVEIVAEGPKHDEPERSLREKALELLTALGPVAAPAVPDLLDVLEEGRSGSFEEIRAIEALGEIGPAAAPAVPRLIRVLKPSDNPLHVSWYHGAAARALGSIGPAAREALPRLKEVARDADEETARVAAEAVRKIEGAR